MITAASDDSPLSGPAPLYSVVVPFFNEEDAVGPLLSEISTVLQQLDAPWECLCVDDASSDATARILTEHASADSMRFRVITFPQNRGQAAALYRGLAEACGDIIITMDGDGQNDPADIPLLLASLDSADLVCGIRATRHDTWLRKRMSRFANRVRSAVLGDGMRDSGCALKVMRREVVGALMPIRTLYSFIPAQAVAAGFRVAERPVNHRARQGGVSSYGLRAFFLYPLIDMMGMLWVRRRTILTTEDCRHSRAGRRPQ
ncbi:MAG: glycosyltransferase family 2 protein [Lentisphaerae bacterium]|nr:glycosyltransferase family 2 protein [Lentisphaerota bacterium]